MVVNLVRIVFLLVVLAVTISFGYGEDVTRHGVEYVTWYILLPAAFAVLLILGDMLWRGKRLQLMSGLFFGVLAGLVIAYVFTLIVDLVVAAYPVLQPSPIVKLVKVLLGTAAVFLCVSFVLQTKDDFRFVIPYVEFSRQTKGPRPLLLDTSAIIDGRIADISETRILESEMIVPRFVLAELQGIADSDDRLRRNRGRRGLDVLNRLRSSDKLEIRVLDIEAPGTNEADDVDTRLVALAKHLNARVVTNDYNLNKIAQLQGVIVINVNDLANALKPIVLPGEALRVKVIKPGEEPHQGVGYLEDGTMVVVEQGRERIGQEVALTVTSVLQTSAGRMIFGRPEGAPPRKDRTS